MAVLKKLDWLGFVAVALCMIGVLGGARVARAGVLAVPPNNLGLVGYWNFEDATSTIATDFSGKNNIGTLQSSPTWITGHVGNALSFNGVDQYVSIPHSTTLAPTSAVSITAWIKKNNLTFSGGDGIFAKASGSNVSDLVFQMVGVSSSSSVQFSLSDGLTEPAVRTGVLQAGQWYHLGATWDGTNLLLYVNGSLVDSTTSSFSTMQNIGAELTIGRQSSSVPGRHWDGAIDEVRMYNRVISATEMRNMAQGSGHATIKASNNTSLVGYWSFEDGTSTIATDFSGSGHRGTLTNGPTWGVGHRGTGLTFSSASLQYVDLGDINNFTSGGFSLSLWFRTQPVAASMTLLRKRPASGNNGDVWMLMNSSGNVVGALHDGTSAFGANSSPLTYDDGLWHHAVSVVSTANVTLYVDGVAVATSANHDNNFPTNTDSWKIGGNTRESSYWDGEIDEVRMYHRALSAAEVLRLYTAEKEAVKPVFKPLNRTSLRGYWNFDDASGTRATDFSGNSNNGILNSFNFDASSGWFSPGQRGGALQFDGSDDYVSTGKVVTTTGPMTITAWFKEDVQSSAASIAAQYATTANSSWRLINVNGKPEFRVVDGDGTTTRAASVASTLLTGRWYFVAGVYDEAGGTVSISVDDGAPVSTALSGTVRQLGTETLTIGARSDGAAWRFDGSIDDVRVYNRVLSRDEILNLYLITK